jgi:hypothetical protein
MRYIRKNASGQVEEYLDRKMMGGLSWYSARGYVEYNGTHPVEYLDIVDGKPVELEIPEPEFPKVYTKNQIRTACIKLGLEEKLDNILEAYPKFRLFWNECLEVDLDYEMTRQALALGEFSDEDINNIMTDINTVEEPEPEEWI